MTEAPPIRCPSCAAVESFWVKACWAWRVQMTGWLWWRKLRAVREQIGDCVVCLRCDQPYVMTAAGSFAKRKPSVPPAVQARSRDGVAELQAAVNALPDEAE